MVSVGAGMSLPGMPSPERMISSMGSGAPFGYARSSGDVVSTMLSRRTKLLPSPDAPPDNTAAVASSSLKMSSLPDSSAARIWATAGSAGGVTALAAASGVRSEEHTSELQSLM